MPNLNLADDERAVLTKLVRDSIAADPYPLSPRIRRLKALLAKLDSAPSSDGRALPASQGMGQQHDRTAEAEVLKIGREKQGCK